MPEPRIAPLDPPYAPEIQAMFDRVMPAGAPPIALFRTVGRDRRLLERFFGGALLDRGNLTLGEREIVILRTCARCRAEYEWGVHVKIFADKARLTQAQVAATVSGGDSDPAFTADQAMLVRLVDALHETNEVPDELWAALAARWPEPALIELVMLTGFYTKVAYLTNALRLAPEPGAPGFPD